MSYQEFITNFDLQQTIQQAWEYVNNHSFSAVCIAIAVFLSPFLVRAALMLLWRCFVLLGEFFFKDRFRACMRRVIGYLLRRFVNGNLDVGDTPLFQTNMVTLYNLTWKGENVSADISRAEIRVNMGATFRNYTKLWFKHFFVKMDYHARQRDLLCDSIKELRLSHAEVEIVVPDGKEQAVEEPAEISAGRPVEVVEKNSIDSILEEIRRLDLCIYFERWKISFLLGEEKFEIQNFGGRIKNKPAEVDGKCEVSMTGLYEENNVSFKNIDDSLQHFVLTMNNLLVNDKLLSVARYYIPDLPQNIKIEGGNFQYLRLALGLTQGKLSMENLSARLEETNFQVGEHKVDNLEFSLCSEDMNFFKMKKLACKADGKVVEIGCDFVRVGNCVYADRVDVILNGFHGVIKKAYYNFDIREYGGKTEWVPVEETMKFLDNLKIKMKNNLEGLPDRIKNIFSFQTEKQDNVKQVPGEEGNSKNLQTKKQDNPEQVPAEERRSNLKKLFTNVKNNFEGNVERVTGMLGK